MLYHAASIPAPNYSTAFVDKFKVLPGGCQINVGACRQIGCNAALDGCSWNTFFQPIMEEREFHCNATVYIEKVVKQCSCQRREKIEVRGRVVDWQGNVGNVFVHVSLSFFLSFYISFSLLLLFTIS